MLPLLGGAVAAIITPVDKIAERVGRKCSILMDARSLITISAAGGRARMVWHSSTVGDFLCGVSPPSLPAVATTCMHGSNCRNPRWLSSRSVSAALPHSPSRRRLKTFSRHASPALQRLDPYRCEKEGRPRETQETEWAIVDVKKEDFSLFL